MGISVRGVLVVVGSVLLLNSSFAQNRGSLQGIPDTIKQLVNADPGLEPAEDRSEGRDSVNYKAGVDVRFPKTNMGTY